LGQTSLSTAELGPFLNSGLITLGENPTDDSIDS